MRLEVAGPGRPNDLVLASSYSVIVGMISLLAPQIPGLWLLALIGVFILPGYCVLSAISPGKGFLGKEGNSMAISTLERAVVSVMLSISFIALTSTILSWSDWGLNVTSAAFEVSVITVLGSVIAYLRRSILPASEQFTASIEIRNPFLGMNLLERGVTIFVVIIFVASTFLVLSASMNTTEPYTQLTITGASGALGDLPQTAAADQNVTVRITILNRMNHDLVYNLTVGDNGTQGFEQFQSLDWFSPETLMPGVGFVSSIYIASGNNYSANLVFRVPSPGTVKVLFLLSGEHVNLDNWLFLTVT